MTQSVAPQHNSQTLPLLSPAINLDPHPAVGGGDIALVDGQALMAPGGPSGTAADPGALESYAISVYTVHKGDTLGGIAKMFDVSVNTIVWANDLSGKAIHEGDQLVVLPFTGVRYTVAKGDTLASIAKKFKADVGEIAQANDLSAGAALLAGNTLMIPDGEVVAPAPKPGATNGSSHGGEPLRGAIGPVLSGFFQWPVNGGVITQGLHGYNGVDIGAPTGTAVYAAAAGTVLVARASGWNGGYGNYVVVQHSNGTQTLYSHASKVLVSAGDQVARGALIAKVGSTGKSTGPHLHFEVHGARNPFGSLALGRGE